MNTNMTGFRCFFKNLCGLVLWLKVALALEGLKLTSQLNLLSNIFCIESCRAAFTKSMAVIFMY